MSSVQVVVPDDYPVAYGGPDHPQLQRLAEYGTVTVHASRWADRDDLFRRLAPAAVVINVRAYTVFDDEALAHAPNLKLVSILGTGTDNVDLEAATRRGVVVTNTPGIGAVPVAELALALMMATVRPIVVMDRRLRAGLWQHEIGPELYGKSLLLLVLGAIAQHFARIGTGLGAPPLPSDGRGGDLQRLSTAGLTTYSACPSRKAMILSTGILRERRMPSVVEPPT